MRPMRKMMEAAHYELEFIVDVEALRYLYLDNYSKLNRLKKLQNQFQLKDNDTLSKYHQSFWEEFIFNASKQYKNDSETKNILPLTPSS